MTRLRSTLPRDDRTRGSIAGQREKREPQLPSFPLTFSELTASPLATLNLFFNLFTFFRFLSFSSSVSVGRRRRLSGILNSEEDEMAGLGVDLAAVGDAAVAETVSDCCLTTDSFMRKRAAEGS